MTPTLQRFQNAATAKSADAKHRTVIRRNMATYHQSVVRGKARFLNWEEARARAAQAKWEVVNHLDRYLEQFEQNVTNNGGHVHWAETADEACAIILDLARRHNVRKVVKGKSMATEEIHLNDAFAAAGIQSVETDLGEFICQLRGEPPYHLLTPAMHLSKADFTREFHEKLGAPMTDDPQELTMIARQWLRKDFLSADMGVTGANFAVADLGMIALTENEGNIRLSFSLPRVHVALVGIEKLVPRLEDLAVLWPVLGTMGTGQALTSYSSLVGGPRAANEQDGPEEFHVVLLDNGRIRLLADVEQRDALQCIRCGACLNSCPIYESIGGHAYGTTYQGPIGSVITPHLRGMQDWSHLPYASALCGACTSVCPVHVDLHHHLFQNRRNAVQQRLDPWLQRLAFRVWRWAMEDSKRYALAGKLGRFALQLGVAQPFLKPWTKTREFPPAPAQSFRDWWASSSSALPTGGETQPSKPPEGRNA
jgi:L-lactate dehydrogenase complex protein LldF